MEYLNTALGRFFVISIAIHMGLLILIRMEHPRQTQRREPIAVSLLPPRDTPSPPAPRSPRAEPTPRAPETKPPPRKTRPAPTPPKPAEPAVLAKKETPVKKQVMKTTTPRRVPTTPVRKPRAEPAPREPIQETTVVAERPLPTLKELLPSAIDSSANPQGSSVVSLNTRDPIYVSYFTKIKQSIEQNWEYPEVALRYGLHGRLLLQFTIDASGILDQLRLIRSSGSQVLDEEALRAIKAAAPFPPIPSWIEQIPLTISASMVYSDNRLNDRATR